jgi:hypothetical protein
MLDPADYDIVVRCRTKKAQMLLEHAIEREFAAMQMNYESIPPAQCNAGTCHGIKFEITA